MKTFSFKNFEVQQSDKVFRVGTDGVLLGAFADVKNASNILEVGSGTGLVSLMMAQRNPFANILALDISKDAAKLTKINFENSVFNQRLKNLHQDFKNFETEEKFDLIVSNPPYFEVSESEKDKIARQTVELNFRQLISKSSKLLSQNGIISVIIPMQAGNNFMTIAEENRMFLIKIINIKGVENSKIKRLILEFSLHKNKLEESVFVIEKSPRQYSDQYLELTKEFHIFKK